MLIRSVLFRAAGPILLHFFRRWHFQGTDDAKADELRVGEIPDTLWQLRILHFPGAVGAAPRGAAAGGRRIVPGTSADGMGIRLGGLVPRIEHGLVAGGLFVVIRLILVEDPLGHVAIHIVKGPRIWILLS